MTNNSEAPLPRRSWSKAATLTAAAIGGIIVFMGIENIPAATKDTTPPTCREIGDAIVSDFTDRFIHPVRIMEHRMTASSSDKIECSGRAWLNTGAEVDVIFELRYTPDGNFLFFQPVL